MHSKIDKLCHFYENFQLLMHMDTCILIHVYSAYTLNRKKSTHTYLLSGVQVTLIWSFPLSLYMCILNGGVRAVQGKSKFLMQQNIVMQSPVLTDIVLL